MLSIIIPSRGSFALYPDTSFLLSVKNQEELKSVDQPRITLEVIEEIRVKKDVTFNSYLDRLLPRSRIMSRDSFKALRAEKCYDLIYTCASMLCPNINPAIIEIDRMDLPIDKKLKKCLTEVQRIARASHLWARDHFFFEGKQFNQHKAEAIGPNIFNRTVLKNIPKLHKAWFKYHRERFSKTANGEYKWTDEKLAVSALAEALLEHRISIILTNDIDFKVIMKQFTDNLVLHTCVQNLQRKGESFGEEEVFDCFQKRCGEVETFRKKTYQSRLPNKEQISKIMENYPAKYAVFGLRLWMCRPGELLIWYSEKEWGSHFVFNKFLVKAVFNYAGLIFDD